MTAVVTLFTTPGAGTWSVPSDWNNANNKIESIGGGGGGGTPANNFQGSQGSGGGGGAYASASNIALTPSATVNLNVGSAGAANNSGGSSWFNGSAGGGNNSCQANGGSGGGSNAAGGAGGTVVNGTGFSGGAGGATTSGSAAAGGGGGGGAAGPSGAGKAGGASQTNTNVGGAGGGGANGGSSSAGASPGSGISGAGGNGTGGTGGGAAVASGIPGNNGTANSGGGASGGGGDDNPGFITAQSGGNGATSIISAWGSVGPGGGGGGGGSGTTNPGDQGNGGTGAAYGGGGGGGGVSAGAGAGIGGAGGQGLVVVTYTPAIANQKSVPLSQVEAITLRRATSTRKLSTLPLTATLLRGTAKKPFAVTSAETLAFTRSGAIRAKLLSMTQGYTLHLVRQTAHTVAVLLGYSLSLVRLVAHRTALVQVQAVGLLKSAGKLLPKALQGQSLLAYYPKLLRRTLLALQPQLISMRRNLAKIIRPLLAQVVTPLRPRRVVLLLQAGEHVRLLKGVQRRLSFALPEVATLRKGLSKRLSLALGSLVTLRRGVKVVAAVELAQFVALRRFLPARVQAMQGQMLRTTRQVRRQLLLLIPELVTLAKAKTVHLQKLLTFLLLEAVALSPRHGKQLSVGLEQVAALPAKAVSKFLAVRWSQLVAVLSGPNIQALDPTLFAYGLFRNRTVIEIPDVAATNVLEPPIEPVVETENVAFDYGFVLDEGVKILSAVVTATVYDGTDPNPSAILISYPVVALSPRTGKVDQAVVQQVGQTVANVTYRIQCVATASDGQVKALVTLLQSQASL